MRWQPRLSAETSQRVHGSAFYASDVHIARQFLTACGSEEKSTALHARYDAHHHFAEIVNGVETAIADGLNMTALLPLWSFAAYSLDLPGTDRIEPHGFRYSKPVLVLINEMSGSGGDLFPAMIKDLGRARLFGKRTMGAGGHAWDDPHLNLKNSAIEINLTRSLIYRPNGHLIENSGVEPDIDYDITIEDFVSGFKEYFKAAEVSLLQML